MSARTNWRALQVPPRRETGKNPVWCAPTDTNVKHMSMGSWHASVTNGGARRPRKGNR